MIHMTRTGKGNYQYTANGVTYSVTKLAGAWFAATSNGEVLGDFRLYPQAVEEVETAIINAQNKLMDAAIEKFEQPCYDGRCLYAHGPICTCSCGGAGHQLGYIGTLA